MESISIAYFITPHGFGHASRAAAVMTAVHQILPQVRFELFTTCPAWIFTDSVAAPMGYHPVQTDVGMVQSSPLQEDVPATCYALDRWLPFNSSLVAGIAVQLSALNCRLVICDISALGIVAAKKAALTSVLIESFTWDWIYSSYKPAAAMLRFPARYLQEIYQQTDHHIQTEPLCRPLEGVFKINPIHREPRSSRELIRQRLGIPEQAKMVLASMGGIPDRFAFLDLLPPELNLHIVIPGADGLHASHPKIIQLPAHSAYYHPDLIAASDVLIGKAGYSTIAEAFFTGVPFGYLSRPLFPESQALAHFITKYMSGRPISHEDYTTGDWIEALPDLLSMPTTRPSGLENGAKAAARFLRDLLE